MLRGGIYCTLSTPNFHTAGRQTIRYTTFFFPGPWSLHKLRSTREPIEINGVNGRWASLIHARPCLEYLPLGCASSFDVEDERRDGTGKNPRAQTLKAQTTSRRRLHRLLLFCRYWSHSHGASLGSWNQTRATTASPALPVTLRGRHRSAQVVSCLAPLGLRPGRSYRPNILSHCLPSREFCLCYYKSRSSSPRKFP